MIIKHINTQRKMIKMIHEINGKEYRRLYNEEINNQTSWIFKSNICLNSL